LIGADEAIGPSGPDDRAIGWFFGWRRGWFGAGGRGCGCLSRDGVGCGRLTSSPTTRPLCARSGRGCSGGTGCCCC
jgi:hypothetical protein